MVHSITLFIVNRPKVLGVLGFFGVLGIWGLNEETKTP